MEALITQTLKRAKKTAVELLLLRWGRLDTRNINFHGVKSDYTEELVHLCQESGVSYNDAAKLELLFIASNPRQKNWEAYKLRRIKMGGEYLERENIDVFETTLHRNMNEFLHCDVTVMKRNKSFWCRVSVPETTNAVYVIYFPNSNHFVSTHTASKLLKQYVLNAVTKTLNAEDWELLPLNGRCLDSLAQILLHTSKDETDKYDFDEGYYMPKRRKIETLATQNAEGVTLENARQKTTDWKKNEECFGPYIQPMLQNVSIGLSTKFKGDKALPELPRDTILHGKVTFSGPDVLEGMRCLVSENLAIAPLPNYLSQIGKIGKSSLVILEK